MDQEYEIKYLKSLAKLYPTIASASTEIINLQSIFKPSKRNRAFYDGHSRRVRTVSPCSEEWVRFCAQKN